MKFNLQNRLIDFTVQCCDLAESLPKTRTGNHLADHFIRAGISPSLNYSEATRAESRNDFVHKMKICIKELRETLVCMKIITLKKMHPDHEPIIKLMKENDELVAIFHKSITTAKSNTSSSIKVK
ncbi:MAG: four helix bundle protein [Chitinophagales bacterium]